MSAAQQVWVYLSTSGIAAFLFSLILRLATNMPGQFIIFSCSDMGRLIFDWIRFVLRR